MSHDTVLIGEGAFALRCLEAMLGRGLAPVRVCSFDDSLTEACKRHGLVHVDRRDALESWLLAHGCDDLLSARNPWIVPARVLARVRHCAINFHDAPLPRYAGVHATAWAILHGERTHGICWHEMTPGIDEGRVLVATDVPITPEDTAVTLNARCFDAGVEAFSKVLDVLQGSPPCFVPQQGPRSMFRARDRPPAQCILDLEQPGHAVVNMVRALDFGHAFQPLGQAKLWLGDHTLVLGGARLTPTLSTRPAGTLLASTARGLRLATSTFDVELECHATQAGIPLQEREWTTPVAPYLGRTLPRLSAEDRAVLSRHDAQFARSESMWRTHLKAEIVPLEHPYIPPSTRGPLRAVALPLANQALADVPPERRRAVHRAIVAAYFVRIDGRGPRDLGVLRPAVTGPAQLVFAAIVPWRMPDARDTSFEAFATEIEHSFAALEQRETFARDLFARDPALRNLPGLPKQWPMVVASTCGESHGTVVAPPPGALQRADVCGASLVVCLEELHVWAAREISADALASLDHQLAVLAHAALAEPRRAIATLPVLDAASSDALLTLGQAETRPIPSVGIHTLFEQQARRTPQAFAVRFANTGLRYAELEARANQLAHALIRRGVTVEDRVALSLGRGCGWFVAIFGVLKAGAAYVPIDPHLPVARIQSLLRRSRPALLIYDCALDPVCLDPEQPLLSLDEDVAAIASEPITAPDVTPDADRIAYVIFTSGSTGEPKGVEIRHRGLINHALGVQEHYRFTATDRMLCSASLGFDVAGEQIYPPLLHGAEVVIRPDDLLTSLQAFDAFVRTQGITTLTLPTTFWHAWVRHLDARELCVPSSLRVLATGTEAVLTEALAIWQRRRPHPVRFIQGYGPTEATITCTMFVHDDGELDRSRPLPIGRPLLNTEIYLLDANGAPVPMGMPGELCVGGLGLARGYLDDPERTAARFVPHPFRSDPDSRVYRTGDLARYEPDGQLVFLGRIDQQIKINGHRVEPGEIEAVLRTHPDVHEAVVVLRDLPDAPKQLVAYIVARPGWDEGQLDRTCRAHLPAATVPTCYVALDRFPRNRNDKIDYARLPPPTPKPRSQPRQACDNVELIVAGAFAEALKIRNVPMTDGFFELGGDSLAAVALLDRLERAFGGVLPLAQLFRTPSVETLAAFIRTRPHGSAVDNPTVVCLKNGEGPPIFLVLGLFLYQALARALTAPNPVYAVLLPTEAALLRRGDPLPTVEALAQAYVDVLQTHTPHGPYVIGGASFGGLVAYQIARQLSARGESVPLVVLLDSILPRGRLGGVRPWVHLMWHTLLRAPARLEAPERRPLPSPSPSSPAPGDDAHRARLQAWRDQEYERAQRAYDRVLHPYTGRVMLCRSSALRRPLMPHHGFEHHVTGPIDTIDVPGDHMSMLLPGNVDVLTRALDHRLADTVIAMSDRRGSRSSQANATISTRFRHG